MWNEGTAGLVARTTVRTVAQMKWAGGRPVWCGMSGQVSSEREMEYCMSVGEGHAQRGIDRIFFSNLNVFLKQETHEDVLTEVNNGRGG